MSGKHALLGYIPVGAVPRQFAVEPGGKVALVTVQNAHQLEAIDVEACRDRACLRKRRLTAALRRRETGRACRPVPYDQADEGSAMTRTATRSMRTPRSRRRRGRGWIITLVVIIVLLVVLDFAARAAAENVMASKIQQQGLQHRPGVSIDGFPFLTQVASKDFQQVNLTAHEPDRGPGHDHQHQCDGAQHQAQFLRLLQRHYRPLSGTALISFASLGNTLAKQVGPLGSLLNGAGLNLTAAGPDEVRASLNLLVLSGSATWRVTRLSGNRLHIRLVSSSGLHSSLLGSIQDITIQIPKLPLGLTIDSVQVTPSGVVGQVSGTNVPFGS